MMRRRNLLIPNKQTGTYIYRNNSQSSIIVDTNICLTDVDKNFSIIGEVSFPNATYDSNNNYYRCVIGSGGNNSLIFIANNELTGGASPASLLGYANYLRYYWMDNQRYQYTNSTKDFFNPSIHHRFCYWHEINSNTAHLIYDNTTFSAIATIPFTASNETIKINASSNSMTVHDFIIYNKILTASEITNYIQNGIII